MKSRKKDEMPKRRCAVYTRKSTREGLDQDFSSVDAQREAAESYIESQKGDGWICLPDRYDDGGYTGANMKRPGLQKLLQDVEDKKVDCIVVYKVDRMSRTIMDFLSMIRDLDEKGVAFVSVTQNFDTRTSLGRLILNILLSFAQFEREMISERTSDKIAATRRKGKWSGGRPVLGYDLQSEKTCLTVNEKEAEQVQKIYSVYLQEQGLLATLHKINELGYTNKQWITRKGKTCGGSQFSRNTLHHLLTNVLYIGKITYKDEVHEGEHPAIIDADIFRRVQVLLKRNGKSGGAETREKSSALLKGMIQCVPCQRVMTPNFTTKQNKRYRYYTCLKATEDGWDSCPSPSVPAVEIERFVIDQIRCINKDPKLIDATIREAHLATKKQVDALKEEEREVKRDLNSQYRQLNDTVKRGNADPESMAHTAILQERIETLERRIKQIDNEILVVRQKELSAERVRELSRSFDSLWEALTVLERGQLLRLIVERVDYDGRKQSVTVKFYDTCIKALSDRFSVEQENE